MCEENNLTTNKRNFCYVKIFSNTYLPISGSISLLKHFHSWDIMSKEFHTDGHEQATSISVTACGVYHQEYHQEDHHDNANHTAFGDAVAH